jgi:hypothetical protein
MLSIAYSAWYGRACSTRIEDVILRRGRKLKGHGVERVGPCPKCGGTDRFSINTKKQVWNCRGCGVGGDTIALVRHLDNVDFITACTTLTGEPPPPRTANVKGHATVDKATAKATRVCVAEYWFQDEYGEVVVATERIEHRNPDGTPVLKEDGKPEKSFRQKRPDPVPGGDWIYNVDGARVLPYRLPEVIEAIANGHPIIVVEGEAKVDLLAGWNVTATCNTGGAGKWKSEHSEFLRGADVVIIPDADDAGLKHLQDVGASLSGIAARIRVVMLPDLPAKGDIVDWAKAGGTRERLDALMEKAPLWVPLAPNNDEKSEATERENKLLAGLAGMPKGIAAAREAKRLAKELGVSRQDISAEIEARRVENLKTAPLRGHWIVEPHPEPVEADSLIRDIKKKLLKHVVCTDEDALAATLWIMLAWVHDEVAIHSPILLITSAMPASGKSTMLSVISFLLFQCIATVEISEAALFRSIKRWHPTFAIDEFDDVLAGDDRNGLKAVINSGHTRGQVVIRCVEPDYEPQEFTTFAPKAIGMIGRIRKAATASRCISVVLRRRKKDEMIEKFAHDDDAELGGLRSRLRRWASDSADKLRGVMPSMPEEFDNRCADNWRVQFAIADLAGEDWGDKARAAAGKIEKTSDSRSTNVDILADTLAIFHPTDEDGRPLEALERISSADLVARLCTYPDSPWCEWKGKNPITQPQLARVLKPFGIAPEVVRMPSGGTIRGYGRSQFVEQWERYLGWTPPPALFSETKA